MVDTFSIQNTHLGQKLYHPQLSQPQPLTLITLKTMARIKPFKGLRPPKHLVEQVESRPYDVLDSEEARLEAADNEKSLYHIIKPEINFAPGTSEYDPKV